MKNVKGKLQIVAVAAAAAMVVSSVSVLATGGVNTR